MASGHAVGEGVLKRGKSAGESLAFLPAEFDSMSEPDQQTAIEEALSEIAEMEILRTRKSNDGKALRGGGIVSRNLMALAKLAPGATQKFRALMNAASGMFGLASARTLALKNAIREGRFNESEYEAFLDKMTGRDHHAEHDGMVRDEHAALVGQEAFTLTEDAPFSLVRSNPEREARPLVPLVISFDALPRAERDWHKAIREYIGKHLIGRTLVNKDSRRSITFTGASKREAPSKLRKEPGIDRRVIRFSFAGPPGGRPLPCPKKARLCPDYAQRPKNPKSTIGSRQALPLLTNHH